MAISDVPKVSCSVAKVQLRGVKIITFDRVILAWRLRWLAQLSGLQLNSDLPLNSDQQNTGTNTGAAITDLEFQGNLNYNKRLRSIEYCILAASA